MKTRFQLALRSWFLLLSAIVAMADDNDQRPCTVQSCHNSYDLSPLSASSDYIFESATGRNFTLNVCKPVVSELWNPNVDNTRSVGGFVRGAHGDLSIGQSNTTLHVRDGHPMLVLMDGSSCPQSSSMKASTVIRFICDDTVKSQGSPQFIAQLPPEDDDACAYFIEWRTKYACPVYEGNYVWKGILTAIVIVLAIGVALLSLFIYRRVVRRRQGAGFDLPQDAAHWYDSLSPWGLADHVRDFGRLLMRQDPWGHPNGGAAPNGSASTGSRRWGWPFGKGNGGRDRRHFSRLPRSAEEEAMMGDGEAGRFSIDDEDDGQDHINGNGVPYEHAEESAAWSDAASRPRGLDNSGVIRL